MHTALALALALSTAQAETPAALTLGSPTDTDHCTAPERVVFACTTTKGKWVSICASDDLGADAGSLQYRYGGPGKVELAFPEDLSTSRSAFTWAHTTHVQSASYTLSFQNGDYSYAVYDQLTEGSQRDHGAGVTATKGETRLQFPCDEDKPTALHIEPLKGIVGPPSTPETPPTTP